MDQDLLLYLKFFVLFTCVAFWVRLGFQWVMRHHRLRRERERGDHGF
jgi:hypothetical protein